MTITTPPPPRITMSLRNEQASTIGFQFCFLNKPFVNESNAKEIYYKLLIWPKAKTVIEDFDFLIKINHQGLLKPLELLEFPRSVDNTFDPFGDQHLTVKIPQTFYQSQLQFAFSFRGGSEENQGQINLNLQSFNQQVIDDILLFYDSEEQSSKSLLSWELYADFPKLTFNETYPELLNLRINLDDITAQVTDYESVQQLHFLALIDNLEPTIQNFTVGAMAKKDAYAFEPHFKWLCHENLNQRDYHLQMTNRLALVGNQIREASEGAIGFKANPLVTGDNGLTLLINFLNHQYQFTLPIHQATLETLDQWSGAYYEI